MENNKIQLLSTRPVGAELVGEAGQNNIVIDEVPFIKTDEITSAYLDHKIRKLSHQNITAVFTSINALKMVEKFMPDKPSWRIFCIGNATKKSAEKIFGLENIAGTAFYGNQLAEKIIENSSIKEVVFFCGTQRSDELPDRLKEHGIKIEEVIVYTTTETPKALSKQYDGILFFSPSAVRSFFSKNIVSGNTQIFAIGTTTASAVKNFTQQLVIIAKNPGKRNLVNQAINHFSKTKFSECNH